MAADTIGGARITIRQISLNMSLKNSPIVRCKTDTNLCQLEVKESKKQEMLEIKDGMEHEKI